MNHCMSAKYFCLDKHLSSEAELIKNRVVVHLAKKHPCQDLVISIDNSAISPTRKAKNLGVTLDKNPLFQKHLILIRLCNSCIRRIILIALLLVYKSLNGLGPKYTADMLTEYKPNRQLRSLGSSQLEIPRVHTKQGESAFSYYTARRWNQLPEEIRCAKTLATFKSRLKTHLFSCAFVEWALCYVRTDCTMYNHFLFLNVFNSFQN